MSEDIDMTETSAVCDSYAQWASCNKNNESVILKDDSTTKTSAVYDSYAQ